MTKRQFVFFITDTQGANCVGCYRPDLGLATPHIDRLAARGLRFQRAYTASPVCGPARSALLTGIYPHANGVLANDMGLQGDVPTLGQRLTREGIATAYIGKWHLDGTDYFGSGACPPGWNPDFWMDGRNYLASLETDEQRALSRQVLDAAGVREHGITAEFTHAHRIATSAIRFIETHRDEDFLLVVSIDEPHHPHIAPEPYVSRFRDFLFPVPNADDPLDGKPRAQTEWAAHSAGWEAQMVRRGGRAFLHHPAYFACNSFSDSQVGRVLDAVDRHLPQAGILYTADHGDMFGSHRLHGKGPCMYEENIRVPLVLRWPGRTVAGSVAPEPVSQIGAVPTILEFFGLPQPDLLQGAPLWDAGRNNDDVVFCEFNRFEIDHDGFGAFAPVRCAIGARYKLALNLLDSDELYDLDRDPLEFVNRIADADTASARDRLHDQIGEWMNRTRDPMRGPHWLRRPWSRRDASTWGGPTRPRPADPAFAPGSLLYDTGEPVDRYVYAKG